MFYHFVLAVACLALSSQLQAAPDATQTLILRTGWNLVSIQVGSAPMPVGTFNSKFDDPAKVIEIWGYNASGNPNAPGNWNFSKPVIPGLTNDLTTIEPGKGYWVKIGGGTATAMLTGPAWSGTVRLLPGWNLVGFSGLDFGSSERQELSAIFGSNFDRIQQVWTFDSASSTHIGYDLTAIPQLKTLTSVQPGLGYWVYSIASTAIDLTAQPYVALPPDSDASPPQPAIPYAGSNPRYIGRQVRIPATDGSDTAYDINGNGILDDAITQNTILFEKTADTVSITIGNQGGSGVLNWTLENNVPWLYTAPADARTWPTGATARPRGVSSDKDTLLLYADRTGMSPGRKSGDSITLWVGGQAFPISLLLDIAAIDGDWRGSATTTRVGGRNVSLGEVRLSLNTFSTGGNEASGFRSVLNREQSILFPRDVYMDGVFYAANQFKLTTNFEMKAGDRNAPPYDTFPGDAKDRDFNGDGKVDVMNPFPFGLRREVTLLGSRVTPNRLEGTYIESIRGMLPPLTTNNLITDQVQFLNDAFLTQSQPVFIEGTFVLERQTFSPTKRSVFNQSADLQLGIGGSDPTQRQPTFNVTTPVIVQGVTLTLNLTYPDPALLRITLISPRGTGFVIHDFGDANQPPSSVTIPANIFAGEDGFGEWTLLIEWDGESGERGTLASWGLNIEGVATHQATGRIVSAGTPLTGATIRLEGGVTTQTFTSSSVAGQLGTFTIPNLTENDYTLFISKPGYATTTFTYFVSETDVALGDISISPLAITEPSITAAPSIGYAGTQPLHVEFTLDIPLGFQGTTVAWDYDGNGTIDATGPVNGPLTQTSFEYATPGIYTAKATLSGGGLGTPIQKTQVVHVHRGIADPTGGSTQIMVTAFVGSFGAKADIASASPAATPTETLNVAPIQVRIIDRSGTTPVENVISGVASGHVPQESKWDSASFDQDRFPYSWKTAPNTAPGIEDSDLGLQTQVGGAPANGPAYIFFKATSTNPYKYDLRAALATDPAYDRTPGIYQEYSIPAGLTKPNRFRIATAIGGSVFNTTASTVADIKIQPGRTLP
jgi:subtilisin-like proprotein convertase family protein